MWSLRLSGIGLALGLGLSVAMNPIWAVLGLFGVMAIVGGMRVAGSDSGWRWCMAGLCFGYVVLSRGFSYMSLDLQWVGLPLRLPVYVGEVVLLVCLLSISHRGVMRDYLGTGTARWLVAWVVVGMALTVPNISEYRTEALRDAAMFYYAMFTYVGYAFSRSERQASALFKVLAVAFLVHLGYSITFLSRVIDVEAISPFAPGSEFPLLSYRHDASAVHLLGGVLFALVLARQYGWPAWLRWGLGFSQFALFMGLQIRAAYVGLVLVTFVLTYMRRLGQVAMVGLSIVLLLVVSAALQLEVEILGQTASVVSAERILESAQTILDVGGAGTYRFSEAESSVGNTQWRLEFWEAIVRDGLQSPMRFLLGRGFGPSIVPEGDFVGVDPDRPNRHPHNIAVSILGRMGIAGLVLWVGFNVSVWRLILRGARGASRSGNLWLADSLAFILAYAAAMAGAALFGVLLESPFMAIPYYFLLGVGLRLARRSPGTPPSEREGEGAELSRGVPARGLN